MAMSSDHNERLNNGAALLETLAPQIAAAAKNMGAGGVDDEVAEASVQRVETSIQKVREAVATLPGTS